MALKSTIFWKVAPCKLTEITNGTEKYHYSSTSGMITLTGTALRHSNFTHDSTNFNDDSRSDLSLHSLSKENHDLGIDFFILTDKEGHSNFVCNTVYVPSLASEVSAIRDMDD